LPSATSFTRTNRRPQQAHVGEDGVAQHLPDAFGDLPVEQRARRGGIAGAHVGTSELDQLARIPGVQARAELVSMAREIVRLDRLRARMESAASRET
jgi:hypothetical protein